MSETITTDMIKSISLFEKLEDSDIEKLVQVVQKGSIPSGTEFFKEGDIGDAFYVLTKGEDFDRALIELSRSGYLIEEHGNENVS